MTTPDPREQLKAYGDEVLDGDDGDWGLRDCAAPAAFEALEKVLELVAQDEQQGNLHPDHLALVGNIQDAIARALPGGEEK